jgi:hypothetical protein
MNLNNRQQLLGILAGAALAILVGDRLIVTPLTRLWKERSAEISDTKKSVDQGAQLINRDAVIRERWDRMRTNMLSSDVSVAENQVFRAFERWSQGNRLTINGIKPQWKHVDDYATLECRVDAVGALADVTRFLYEIEKDPLGLKLDLVEVTARDERGQQMSLALQVSGLQLNSEQRP